MGHQGGHRAAAGRLTRPQPTHPLYSVVLMLKPSVGLIVVMSSPTSRLTMVVFPALSKPLQV